MDSKITTTKSIRYGILRRYWRRDDMARPGLWPAGWMPFLGLIIAFLYGLLVTAPAIEAQTAEQVRLALLDEELADLSVTADGQRIVVRATGSQADTDRLLALAGGATCDTWIAPRITCPTRVRVELTARAPAVVEPEPVPEPEPVAVPTQPAE